MKQVKKVLSLALVGLLVLGCLIPAAAGTGKVNINTAGKKELVSLKYVGEKLADKIIAYRKASPFKVPGDIMKVKGVGTKVFEANKDRIVVTDK
jgi:competence protein ComEA